MLQVFLLILNYAPNQTVIWNVQQQGQSVRTTNFHPPLRKNLKHHSLHPNQAAHNSSFTPATDQPMDLDADDADAESQQDETDVGEVGDEADAYERLHTVHNSEQPVSCIYSSKCIQC